MKNLIFTLVFISILGICKGNVVNQPERTVIAVKGLNLRESPTLNGKVITLVPFLDKVALLNEAISSTDTLSTVNFSDQDNNIYPDYIVGEWVKIKYQNKEGYVFNAYLMQEHGDQPLHSEENQFAISFAGLNCVDNVHRNKEIKWKGVFKNGDEFEMKEVQLEYYIGLDEMGAWYGTTTQTNNSPLFIIGTIDDKFKNGQIEGTYFKDRWVFDYSKDFSTYENLTMHILEHEAFVTITEGNQQQKLAVHDGIQIIWKGDLDGDGKNDYIFTSGEVSSSTTLYLSSEAGEDQLVKPVASYYSGYCC